MYSQICECREKLFIISDQIEKRQIELELNANIQKKFKNTLNFVSEARQMIITNKSESGSTENKIKIS